MEENGEEVDYDYNDQVEEQGEETTEDAQEDAQEDDVYDLKSTSIQIHRH